MAIDGKIVNGAIMTVLAIVILFAVYASVVPQAQDAGDELTDDGVCNGTTASGSWNASTVSYTCGWKASTEVCQWMRNKTDGRTACASVNTVPLGGLFSGSSIVFIIIMVALLITIITALLGKNKFK